MSKITEREIQSLELVAGKLAPFHEIEQALIDDLQRGIVLSGKTYAYQVRAYQKFKAQAHIKKALEILGDDSFGAKLGELILEDVPRDKKIAILKVVRALTGLCLKEAKAMVESTPSLVLQDCPPDVVKDAAKQLEKAGAKVSMRFYGFDLEESVYFR